MSITPRWIVLAALAGALSIATATPSYACGNSAWHLASNSLSCLTIRFSTSPSVPASHFSAFLSNTCAASLHVANRNLQSTGTLNLDIAPSSEVELLLPAPAKGGETAVFDCTASTQSGELRFAFTADDDCAGCHVSRPGSSPWSAWVGLSGLVGVAAMVWRRRRPAPAQPTQ